VLATAYRTIFSVAGSYITARLAPNRPMLHALVLGGLGLLVSIVGTVVTWNKDRPSGPTGISRARRARDSAMLGGRQTLRDAVARTLCRLMRRSE